MITIPQSVQDKVEGAFYAYFYSTSNEVNIHGVSVRIKRQVDTRPLAWVRKMLIVSSDAQNQDKWLQIAEHIFLHSDDELLSRFILHRYGIRESAEDTCFELGFEKSAYYRYRTAIIYAFAIKAAAKGLL